MKRAPRVFESNPEVTSMRRIIPEDVLERGLAEKSVQFEHYRELAQTRIPTVELCDVLSPHPKRSRIALENFSGQRGNISLEELCNICLCVRYLQPRSIFEFGTHNGRTTLQLALNAPPTCTVYTLNIHPDKAQDLEHGVHEIDQYLVLASSRLAVGHYFKGTPYEKRIVQLWGDSANFDFSPFQGMLDLIFVDAAHSYEYIKSDSEHAFHMLNGDGIIIWHDYMHFLHPDITHYLYELSHHKAIFHLRDTYLAVHYTGRK